MGIVRYICLGGRGGSWVGVIGGICRWVIVSGCVRRTAGMSVCGVGGGDGLGTLGVHAVGVQYRGVCGDMQVSNIGVQVGM